ncbi:transcriptional regulator [Colwellia sp. PAMC 20917]|jgi:DNA-binding MarR family transcriptional regulator|uniref:MarR family winged helix-turn-helix transcriptional regulator n=1 Tax=unclassified Colwellia TaxID=196834 RepID=UPI000878A039|nr:MULTISPECIES: winged helix DNA-binding protein [unclassified Colwellia]AOW77856.1 transcriptional regulator [Colwellia sp. PAMC 20917]MBA6337350.1 MarR family transcriptional regulator [Colwellia sp. BRX8-7]MBA6347574.1 MarR family transcriptional regulator [Colwellia sp. BRX8-9]MBA6351651.1 MarR family transcriptional regulator [Colwellia sp. BRX9-1]MBA6383454.1 MarR family transcriptional regulator [Colwellia sp. BRX10-9]
MKSLHLTNFFPYQLTQLQVKVSDNIADIYTGRFELSRQEWRVLASLGNGELLSAKQIGEQTNLEKMPASRAITRMQAQGLLVKNTDKSDKRSSLLKLTTQGLAIYQQLIPMVLAREQELLSVLSAEEKNQLANIIEKLTLKSVDIANQ